MQGLTTSGGDYIQTLGYIIGSGVGLIVVAIGTIILAKAVAKTKYRKGALEGFQYQDSNAFQLAVRATLEEAIDQAGIEKALIQPLSKEEGKERRLI